MISTLLSDPVSSGDSFKKTHCDFMGRIGLVKGNVTHLLSIDLKTGGDLTQNDYCNYQLAYKVFNISAYYRLRCKKQNKTFSLYIYIYIK